MIFNKKTVKEVFIKKALIIKYTPRPEILFIFGVIPCHKYLMAISRTRYYEYKKLGLEVHKVEDDKHGLSDYYVRVYKQGDVAESDFYMKPDLPIRFKLYQYNNKKARLYFSANDIGKTRYSK